MPKTKLAPYWSPWHTGNHDSQVFEKWQPRVIKVMTTSWSSCPQLDVAMRYAENVIVRSHPLSEDRERFGNAHYTPAEIGSDHALALRTMNDNIREIYGFSDEQMGRILYEGINEPRVWSEAENPQAIAEYYTALINDAAEFGLRIVAGNFGVGWVGNNGGDSAPPDWTPFAEMAAAINEHNGMLGVHEYWGTSGIDEGWGWLAGRYKFIPFDVPIVITECGIDTGVMGLSNIGWHYLMTEGLDETAAASRYVYDQLGVYDAQLQLDKRIVAATIFTYDIQDGRWDSFNINHNDILNNLYNHFGWVENEDTDNFDEKPLPPYDEDVAWFLPPFGDPSPIEPPIDPPIIPPGGGSLICKLLTAIFELLGCK